MQYGGLVVVAFLAGLIPQVVKNARGKIYQSGSLASWVVFCFGYFAFALYEFLIGERLVGWLQLIGGVLCTVIIVQSFIFGKKQAVVLSTRGKILAALLAAEEEWNAQRSVLLKKSDYALILFLRGVLSFKEGDAQEAKRAIREGLRQIK